jgi:Arc/MetJ-type ribon-helix-helix transcriptional regulator
MAIQLRPEVEELIRQDVERGPYRSVEEFVEQAVTRLHEQEAYLLEHADEISAQIEEGWLAAERGEFTSAEELKAELEKRRDARSHPRSA